jgi:hypothetical protein
VAENSEKQQKNANKILKVKYSIIVAKYLQILLPTKGKSPVLPII